MTNQWFIEAAAEPVQQWRKVTNYHISSVVYRKVESATSKYLSGHHGLRFNGCKLEIYINMYTYVNIKQMQTETNMKLRTNCLKSSLFGCLWKWNGRAFLSRIAWKVNELDTKPVWCEGIKRINLPCVRRLRYIYVMF